VDGLLELQGASQINASTYSIKNAGKVDIRAGDLRIDAQASPLGNSGILSGAGLGAEGNAGDIVISVDGLIELLDGAQITSRTFGAGEGGRIRIQSAQLLGCSISHRQGAKRSCSFHVGSEGASAACEHGRPEMGLDPLLDIHAAHRCHRLADERSARL